MFHTYEMFTKIIIIDTFLKIYCNWCHKHVGVATAQQTAVTYSLSRSIRDNKLVITTL